MSAAAPTAPAPAATPANEHRSLPRTALHLIVLASLAIAQPLFDLLGRYPAFFAAHDLDGWGVVAFALVVLLVPPLVLFAIAALATLVDRRAGWAVHLVWVGVFVALFALEIVRRFGWGSGLTFAVAILLGALGAAAYAQERTVRWVLTLLGVAPLVFLGLFLFNSNASTLITSGAARVWDAKGTFRPPIVMVTFDAFPVQMLMDRRDHIDAERFPHFAELARHATWYPNATNVHENTTFSVPSILDGQIPRPSQSPTVQDHPNNLFTLLGHTYEMRISEEATNLCPHELCRRPNEGSSGDKLKVLGSDVATVFQYLVTPKGLQNRLPTITDRWRDFRNVAEGDTPTTSVLQRLASGQRPNRFRRSVAAIAPESQPTLDFMHVLLPHEPLEYLPTGQSYQQGDEKDVSVDGPPSYDNAFLTDQAFQRHLLQVGYTDRLLGELIARLKQTGLWNKALIVVTADHGVSFRVDPKPAPPFTPGKLGYRRDLTQDNAQDIVTVPLFVHYPGQKKGREDTKWGRTIDVVPTIADVLGIRLPFHVDGRSLRGPRPVPATLTYEKTDGTRVTVSTTVLERRKDDSLRHQLGLLGTTWADAYRIGPHRELIGRPVAALPRRAASRRRAHVNDPGALANVNLDAPLSPTNVVGRISGDDPAGRDLAFALNGTIVSTGVSFKDLGPRRLNFSTMLPSDALRAGRNELRIYEIDGSSLVPIGGA